ncbi:MAG: hypothetical protein RO257_08865 [Candidatus Kapabacteria bacterium]|nr:hypothetical protein [Candidatus Kapabacteria bacterium]
MNVTINVTETFKRLAKPLLKKYPSLKSELSELENELLNSPRLGEQLGNDAYKIRVAVQSKGKGKRGGMRVISYVETIIFISNNQKSEQIEVNLISIYDKGKTATLSNQEIKNLIYNIRLRKLKF